MNVFDSFLIDGSYYVCQEILTYIYCHQNERSPCKILYFKVLEVQSIINRLRETCLFLQPHITASSGHLFQAHSYSSVLVLKSEDSITSRFEPMKSRFLPVNMTSSRFYLPSLPSVPVFPCSPYYGGYVRMEMSFPHQGKDTRVLPGCMSHCYYPALQGISYHSIDEEKPTQSYIGLIGTEGNSTAPFNNMRTLKFEAQPTNGFFAAVNQVFGGSS